MARENLLLSRLPRDVYERIKNDLVRVRLNNGTVVHRPGEEIRDLYFPETCMISIVIMMADGRTVETGAIGNREVAGINAFMGGSETTQTEYVVQLAGDSLKIGAEPLKIEFNRNTEMRDLMLKYTQAYVAQISQNVACIRLHTLEQRFARWLLEVRERSQSETFKLTQEFISQMLGVRRAGITVAALALKDKNIIEYNRGAVSISDVNALFDLSCGCYQTLKDEYDRLLGARSTDSLGSQ